jgi:pSer/pThr/pTyr-binding forkhead associated (FHA) protein
VSRFAIRSATESGAVDVPLPPDRPLVIGREPGCDVVVADATVSRQHCEVFLRDGRPWLRHLSATNVTYVNGRVALGERPLEPGDVLRLPVQEVSLVTAGDG